MRRCEASLADSPRRSVGAAFSSLLESERRSVTRLGLKSVPRGGSALYDPRSSESFHIRVRSRFSSCHQAVAFSWVIIFLQRCRRFSLT